MAVDPNEMYDPYSDDPTADAGPLESGGYTDDNSGDYEARIQELEAALQEAQASLTQYETENADLASQLEATTGERDQLVSDLEGMTSNYEAEVEAHQADIEERDTAIADLQGQLGALPGTLEEQYQPQIEAAQGETEAIRGQLTETEGQLTLSEQQRGEAEARVAQLEGELQQAQLDLQTAQTEEEAGLAQNEVDAISGELDDLNNLLEPAPAVDENGEPLPSGFVAPERNQRGVETAYGGLGGMVRDAVDRYEGPGAVADNSGTPPPNFPGAPQGVMGASDLEPIRVPTSEDIVNEYGGIPGTPDGPPGRPSTSPAQRDDNVRNGLPPRFGEEMPADLQPQQLPDGRWFIPPGAQEYMDPEWARIYMDLNKQADERDINIARDKTTRDVGMAGVAAQSRSAGAAERAAEANREQARNTLSFQERNAAADRAARTNELRLQQELKAVDNSWKEREGAAERSSRERVSAEERAIRLKLAEVDRLEKVADRENRTLLERERLAFEREKLEKQLSQLGGNFRAPSRSRFRR